MLETKASYNFHLTLPLPKRQQIAKVKTKQEENLKKGDKMVKKIIVLMAIVFVAIPLAIVFALISYLRTTSKKNNLCFSFEQSRGGENMKTFFDLLLTIIILPVINLIIAGSWEEEIDYFTPMGIITREKGGEK